MRLGRRRKPTSRCPLPRGGYREVGWRGGPTMASHGQPWPASRYPPPRGGDREVQAAAGASLTASPAARRTYHEIPTKTPEASDSQPRHDPRIIEVVRICTHANIRKQILARPSLAVGSVYMPPWPSHEGIRGLIWAYAPIRRLKMGLGRIGVCMCMCIKKPAIV